MSVSSRRRRTPLPGQFEWTLELAEHLADDLAERWSQGERPTTEEYLAQHPHLAARPESALELVCEEIYQRRLAGQSANVSQWLERFPQWRSQIEMLLACDALLELESPEPQFPKPNEKFGDFDLLEQLGRGAHGRVYLARQMSLADRPLVLKLSAVTGHEHTSLARLQHTHIMPLYWAQDFPKAGLRALCMPYFGGATLADLLARLSDTPPTERSGAGLLAALVQAGEERRLAPAVDGPACRFWEHARYVDIVCSIGACLAEALDYAHQRGIVHYDLKPSNVLIAADGQPLLLDFHLAQPPLAPGESCISWLGGTPRYMAPEQLAALEATEADAPVPCAVDGRADIYSLAMVLVEALAGQTPKSGERVARWLRRENGHVGAALTDSLAKCLSADPRDRYPDAAALASDLRRHLANRSLRHVANRSLAERWRKWRRRRPYALAATLAAAGLLAWGMAEAGRARRYWLDAERELSEALTEIEAGRIDRAQAAIERSAKLAGEIPWQGWLMAELDAARREVAAASLAGELHALVESMRALYGVDGLPLADARRLEAQARRVWDERQSLVRRLAPSSGRSDQSAATDLVELAILWSDLHVRLAPPAERRQTVTEVLDVLLEAERLAGASRALCRAQQHFAQQACQEELASRAARKAAELEATSAWEHYALGRLAANEGVADEAEREFLAAVELDRQGFWPNFYYARAAHERGRFVEAAAAFTACLMLAPEAGWCYYNRALAYLELHEHGLARRDLNRALELEPQLLPAAWNRGMLSYREGRYDEALADLQRASSGAAKPAEVHYGLALVYAARGDAESAAAELDQLFRNAPEHPDGRRLADSLDRATH